MNLSGRTVYIILSLLFSSQTSFAQTVSQKAQSNQEETILESAFETESECYFSFSFSSSEELNSLSKIISIDKVENFTAYAYASKSDFENFLKRKVDFKLLNHPHDGFKADMYDPLLKKTYAWDQYLSYTDYYDLMYQFATDFPEICQVFSIGTSVEGREILMAKISDNITLKEAEPQFLYSGQIHGDELVNSVLLLRLIDDLTRNYATDNQITRLVDGIEIWINPLANPDGLYAGGNGTVNGATRFNANAVDLNRNFPDPEDGEHPDGKPRQQETKIFMQLAEDQHFVMSANTHAGAAVVNYPWDTWVERSADELWWQMVAREYADTAQSYSPAGYMEFKNNGITNGYDWYSIAGGRQDYMNYFQHCREVTLEQSVTKYLPGSQLPNFWNYNRNSLLNYLEQVSFGFRGLVSDESTGEKIINAKIEINGHDNNNSFVFTDSLGYFYRPIKAGSYQLDFSAEGFETVSMSGQAIDDYETKILNISLQKSTTAVGDDIFSKIKITNPIQNSLLQIESPLLIEQLKIYSLLGQLVFSQKTNSTELRVDLSKFQSGIYLVQIDFPNKRKMMKRVIKPF